MAGDWIPARTDLPDDPAVVAITTMTDCVDEDHVVGKLLRFWIWVDRHLETCNAPSVTESFIDRYVNMPGFAKAMQTAGWLTMVPEGGIAIPHFERWFSQSSKRRLLTAKRVAAHRRKCNADCNADRNAASVTKTLPEESTTGQKSKKKPLPFFDPSKIDLPTVLDTPDFREAWSKWIRHRREIHKPLTPTSTKEQIVDFAKWGERRAIAAIEHSLVKGWRGVFEASSAGGTQTNEADENDPLPLLSWPKPIETDKKAG